MFRTTKDTNAPIRKKSNASSCHCVRWYFCKPILQIFYPYTNAPIRKQSNASSCPEHWIPDFISFMRARNPVFWPKWGIKNRGFRALVMSLHNDDCMRLYFVNPSCKYFTKIQTHAMTWRWRCVALFSDWCVCIIVNPSCKYFLQDTNAPIRKSNASSCHCVRLYFCKPILQRFYKEQSNASSCHCMRWYFGKPILQIFYPYTNAPIRTKQRIVMSLRAFVLL